MADLSKSKQVLRGSMERYLSRFKRDRTHCSMALPKKIFVKLATNGLEIEL